MSAHKGLGVVESAAHKTQQAQGGEGLEGPIGREAP